MQDTISAENGAPNAAVNILLVDDQAANLLTLRGVLEGLGQNLVEACSGEEALRLLVNDDFADLWTGHYAARLDTGYLGEASRRRSSRDLGQQSWVVGGVEDQGLQKALTELGAVPERHRSDRLSAAVSNLSERSELSWRYDVLLTHYGLVGKKIQARRAHENGDVESSHRPRPGRARKQRTA